MPTTKSLGHSVSGVCTLENHFGRRKIQMGVFFSPVRVRVYVEQAIFQTIRTRSLEMEIFKNCNTANRAPR